MLPNNLALPQVPEEIYSEHVLSEDLLSKN